MYPLVDLLFSSKALSKAFFVLELAVVPPRFLFTEQPQNIYLALCCVVRVRPPACRMAYAYVNQTHERGGPRAGRGYRDEERARRGAAEGRAAVGAGVAPQVHHQGARDGSRDGEVRSRFGVA